MKLTVIDSNVVALKGRHISMSSGQALSVYDASSGKFILDVEHPVIVFHPHRDSKQSSIEVRGFMAAHDNLIHSVKFRCE